MRVLYRNLLAIAVVGFAAFVIAQEAMVTRSKDSLENAAEKNSGKASEKAFGKDNKKSDKQSSVVPKGLGMEPNIGIIVKNREAVIEILSKLLADEYVLLVKTKNYHWNIVGVQFNDLHLFFDKQYAELAESSDLVAERIRMLGGKTVATMTEFLKLTHLKEQPGLDLPAKEMLKNLLDDHETVIRVLRVDIESVADEFQDMGTNNFLTDLMEKHEKMAWMLRSFLS